MGIRTKLIRRTGGATFAPMFLDVTDLSITTSRNISSFALPVNTALKVGLDFNLPQTLVQIRGVLSDDDMSQPPKSKSDSAIFYCDHIFPRVVSSYGVNFVQEANRMISIMAAATTHITALAYVSSGWFGFPTGPVYNAYDSIDVSDPIPFGPLASRIRAYHPSSRASAVFNDADKVYNVSNNFEELGTVLSTSVANPHGVLHAKLVLDGTGNPATNRTDLPFYQHGNRLSYFNPETFLHGTGFKLVPFAWTKGQNHNLPADNIPIFFKFDANSVSEFSTLGSPVNPSFVSGSEPEKKGLPTIVIPIKGLFTDPEITENPNGLGAVASPAASLAKAIENAINSTLAVSTLPVASGGGSRVVDAFTAAVDSTRASAVVVTSVDTGNRESVDLNAAHIVKVFYPQTKNSIPRVTPADFYAPHLPSYAGTFGTGGLDVVFGEYFNGSSSYRRQLLMSSSFNFKFQGGYNVDEEASGPQSAGDKVQDLLGIFANSPVGGDSEIVGIQIPYQSLISASGVSAETRNFFLTFGSVDAKQKLSDDNTRPASEIMDVVPADVQDLSEDERDEGNFFTDLMGEMGMAGIGEGINSVVKSIHNLWEDVEIALTTSRMGNTGGIRVVPSKFEYSYDAGNTEYTFNMLLAVIHNKIAP